MRCISKEISEDVFVVVTDQYDFFDAGNFGHGGQAMPDDWMASDIK